MDRVRFFEDDTPKGFIGENNEKKDIPVVFMGDAKTITLTPGFILSSFPQKTTV